MLLSSVNLPGTTEHFETQAAAEQTNCVARRSSMSEDRIDEFTWADLLAVSWSGATWIALPLVQPWNGSCRGN